jgi:type VI secretion system protein ImpF
MATTKPDSNDRLAPPLMHAFREAFRNKDARKELDLRDDTGERVIASRRVSARSWVNETALRRDLAEDLTRLLNTVNLASAQDLSEYSYVARSILNYGLTDITAYSSEETAVDDITDELRQTLASYEPRLIADSVEVTREIVPDNTAQKIRFAITAEMHASPVDIPVEFVAELEFDSGKMRISRL